MSIPVPSDELVPQILDGSIQAMARMISRAEEGSPECWPALGELYRHCGRAHIVGITGVPGSGKSTLVRECVRTACGSGRSVGVVAIDPSSPFSGGALLGDRVRMTEVAGEERLFIRSMASRGALGGLARAALEAVDVLDAGGFELILLETVGVGQDEVDIVQVAHTTVVVSAPGLGDEVQAIKAGILEIADIHVVSKFDRPDAQRTLRELTEMLGLAVTQSERGEKGRLYDDYSWTVPVHATSAETGVGMFELMAMIDQHCCFLEKSGEMLARRRLIAERRALKVAEEIIRDRFAVRRAEIGNSFPELDRLLTRDISPRAAAEALLEKLKEDSDNG